MYTRGHKKDFDAWADLGNPGWDWDGLLSYHKRSETLTPRHEPNAPAGGVPVWDAAAHGDSGPIQTSHSPYAPEQYSAIYEGTQEVIDCVHLCVQAIRGGLTLAFHSSVFALRST